MDPQLKRGFLDACVLAALSRGNSYGYEIIRQMPGPLEASESTLYPVLRRLARQGLLSSYTVEHDGRQRRYYAITDAGREALLAFAEDERDIREILAYVERGVRS